MPAPEAVPLIRLGPFVGIETTRPEVYLDSGMATSSPGVNPNRFPGGFGFERGRTNLTNITVGGLGSNLATISEYVMTSSTLLYPGTLLKASAYSRFLFDPNTSAQTLVNFGSSTDSAFYDTAVQFGNVLYDNAGHQFSAANPGNTYLWHYPAPNGVVLGYSVTAGAGALLAATYSYSFTQVVVAPNSGFKQETTSTGSDVPFPYQVVLGAPGSVDIHGTFAGSNPDGSTYTTNVYRQSSLQSVWYLLVNLTTNAVYNDQTQDADITGNVQLTPTRDVPPVSPTNLGAIENHRERMWAFAVVNSALDDNVNQCQLWYSSLGRPWEFDSVDGVILLGNSATPTGTLVYSGQYSDLPVGLKSTGSVLLCFKSRTLWVVQGDSPAAFTPSKVADIGCRSRHSITLGLLPTGAVCFFLSEHGIYETDGNSLNYISEDIRGSLEALSDFDVINAVGSFSHHAYYISFPQSNQTFGYYTSTQKWFGPLPYSTTSAVSVPSNPQTYQATTGRNEVLAVRPTTNYLDYWFTGGDLDLGAPQTATWNGPLMGGTVGMFTESSTETREKYFQYVTICAPAQPGITAQVTLNIDPGSVPPKSYTYTIDLGAGTTQVFSVPTDYRGYLANLSLSVTSSPSVTTPIQVFSVEAFGGISRSFIPTSH